MTIAWVAVSVKLTELPLVLHCQAAEISEDIKVSVKLVAGSSECVSEFRVGIKIGVCGRLADIDRMGLIVTDVPHNWTLGKELIEPVLANIHVYT